MPMAREFNEKLAIDLKVLSNPTGYVLHMIDMWSRYSVSTPLTRKLPNQVIHQVMNSWIRYFGIPGAVLNDNGGEFTAEEVRDMKSVLNIVDLTTGAESPWQNGLCERNHAIVDNMWTRLKEDYPGTPADVLLGWANMARNSMQMVYGFSPNQLVFGSNPNLPNVMNEGLPALEGKSFSETLNHHLDVLHSARKAFTESESSDRVRKALRRKVCSNNTVYHNGDLVWYRRREGDRAMGPGKVVFQDGKVIFIRHGSTYVRVSSNRIVKRGKEFGRNEAVMNTTAPPVTDEEESKNPEPEPLVQVDEAIDETEGREPEEADGLGLDQETEHTATDPVEDNEHNEAEDSIELEENIDAQNQADNDHQVTSPWTTPWSPPPLARELGRTLPSSKPNHQDNTKQSESTDEEAVMEEDEVSERNKVSNDTVISESGKRKRKETDLRLEVKRNKVHYPKNIKPKIKLKKDEIIEIEDRGETITATVLSREKASGSYYNYFNVRGYDGLERNVDLERVKFRKINEEECNMVLIPRSEHKNEACIVAKETELDKLKSFDSYSVVDDIGQYRISTTWVLWNKGAEVRARLVARGFEEQEEVASDSPTLEKCNMKLLLVICASKHWPLESSDVKSAFLQGKRLKRTVTIKPPREAQELPGKLWLLKVALYGLNDASLQFYLQCREVLISLGCQQSKVDPAMFFKLGGRGELIGCVGLHVDDFLHCGTEEFRSSVTQRLGKVFLMGSTEVGTFTYTGFHLDQQDYGIKVDQEEFALKKLVGLELMTPERAKQGDDSLTDIEKSQMRQIAGKVGWLGRGCRPDLVFPQVEMSTKFLNGTVQDLKQAIKVVRRAKEGANFFVVRDLGPVVNWTVELSTDASLSNLNEGVNSTGAYVVLIKNNTGDCAPIYWASNKLRRVVDNTLAAECLSLVEGMKEATYIREVIEETHNLKEKTVPVHAIVDNRSTVDAVHSTTQVTDKKLRRDVGNLKQQLRTGELSSVTWCPGKDQLADCLTKRGAPAWELLRVLQTGRRNQ